MAQKSIAFFVFFFMALSLVHAQAKWQTSVMKINKQGNLEYLPDARGNTIPDFSRVGYERGFKAIPDVPVVKIISVSQNDVATIQSAIDEVAEMPLNKSGFRGAILLRKGNYTILGSLRIKNDGIVLRGEGPETKLLAAGETQHNLIVISGEGKRKEIAGTRKKITDSYVPTGAFCFKVSSTKGFHVGDHIILLRPGTANWISDLKMDQIVPGKDTRQWAPAEYDLSYERIITGISGKTISIDNPVVMAMEDKYGGGEIYKYSFEGRIRNCAVEDMYLESTYASDTDEAHGWDAIHLSNIENGWVRKVTSKYFGYSCVNLAKSSKWITVDSCQSLDAKSLITGGRRYSFNNDGQMNLVMHCYATEGRHDYVTGGMVCGPNVFYDCVAERTHADIGPHHRWASGTLYDNIRSDGEINAQDRGNWGTGHGWSGVTQVFWHCKASRSAVQDPWVSGKNYVIGMEAAPYNGRLSGRQATVWEAGQGSLLPPSLFAAQVAERDKRHSL